MKVSQWHWKQEAGWKLFDGVEKSKSDLVLVFGGRDQLENSERFREIREKFQGAEIVIASTSGEILGDNVYDETITATSVTLEGSQVKVHTEHLSDASQSESVGEKLAKRFDPKGLRYLFVISDGQKVNGTSLLKGINKTLPKEVIVTGGLAGDGARFRKTLVGHNGAPGEGSVIGIGFYGDKLKIGHGSVGGWDSFGPLRKVTKAKGNVLYELDNQPALQLYKQYLGDKAKDLPGSGLLFPLSIKQKDTDRVLVRTILAMDESANSLTFAGDIPEGSQVQLMKANFERLIDGAAEAASNALVKDKKEAHLAILVSCVGRKLVLGQRIDEEIEGVRGVIGKSCPITGFYSYGELSPLISGESCELHNQTMTITTLTEG